MHGRFVVLLRGMPVLMQPLVDGAWHADDPTAGTSTRQIHACDDLLEVLCTYTAGPVCTQVRWTVSFYGLLAGLPLLRNASCVCLSAILARHGRAQAHAPRRQPRSTSAGISPPLRRPGPVQLGRDAPQRRLGRQPQDVLDEQALVVARHDVRKDRRHSRDERERHDDAACSTGERARTPAGQPARCRWPTGQGRDLPVVAPLPQGLAVHWPPPTPGSLKRAHVVRRQRPGQALATLPAAPYTPTSSGRRRPCRRRRRQ